MPEKEPTTDKDRNVRRSHLVRCYEACAKVEYPTERDVQFRESLERTIAAELGLVMGPLSSPAAGSKASGR